MTQTKTNLHNRRELTALLVKHYYSETYCSLMGLMPIRASSLPR